MVTEAKEKFKDSVAMLQLPDNQRVAMEGFSMNQWNTTTNATFKGEKWAKNSLEIGPRFQDEQKMITRGAKAAAEVAQARAANRSTAA